MTDVFALVTNDALSYKVLLALHILAIIGAFGPMMVSSPLNRLAATKVGDAAKEIAEIPMRTAKAVSMPPFIVAVLTGIGLVVNSNDVFGFDQQWISLAFSLVLVIGVVYVFVVLRSQKRYIAAVQNGSPESRETDSELRSARAGVAAGIGIIHLCMLLLIVDMIWKPGL